MSALTKLFVVLLVITSMLTTAGFVVFVNSTPHMNEALNQSKTMQQAAQSDAESMRVSKQQADAQYAQEAAGRQKDNSDWAALSQQQQQIISELKVQIAALTNKQALGDSQVSNLTNVNAEQAGSIGRMQQQNATLLAENEKMVRQADEDSSAIANLRAENDTLRSSYQATQEKLASAMSTVEQYGAALKDRGADPTRIGSQVVPVARPISGQIREKGMVGSEPSATINVGTADGVRTGMQFNVLDNRGQQFLAIFTVTRVGADYAVGKLDGDADKLSKVQAGCDVKTQLRGQ